MDYQKEAGPNHEFEAVSSAVRTVNMKLIGSVLAIVYVCASGFYAFHLGSRVEQAEDSQKTVLESVEMRNKAMIDQLETTEASLKQSTRALQLRIGKTQRQIAARSDALRKQVN